MSAPVDAAPRPGPRALFRALARLEMLTWALLLAAMVLKYAGGVDTLMPFAGGAHGFVFLSYVVVCLLIWADQRWSAGRGLAALGSSVVPFLTVPFERALARSGEPSPHWRLARATARTPAERVVALVLRRPLAAALVLLAGVALVFLLLLQAGPPTEWGAG